MAGRNCCVPVFLASLVVLSFVRVGLCQFPGRSKSPRKAANANTTAAPPRSHPKSSTSVVQIQTTPRTRASGHCKMCSARLGTKEMCQPCVDPYSPACEAETTRCLPPNPYPYEIWECEYEWCCACP